MPPEPHYSLWARANRLLLLLSMCHLAWNLFHQYRMDFNLFRLNHRLLAGGGGSGGGGLDSGASHERESRELLALEISQLNATVHEQHEALEAAWAHGTQLHFAIEVLYLIELITASVSYLLPQYYMSRLSDMNAHLASILIHYEHHLAVCQLQVDEQVSRFLTSSRNFQAILSSRLQLMAAASRRAVALSRPPPQHKQQTSRERELECLAASARRLDQQLVRMAAAGELQPSNSRPARIFAWVPRLAQLTIACTLYGLLMDLYWVHQLCLSPELAHARAPSMFPNFVSVVVVAPTLAAESEQHEVSATVNWKRKLLWACETLALLVPLNCAALYQGSTFIGMAVDMQLSANELRGRLKDFIRRQEAQLGHLLLEQQQQQQQQHEARCRCQQNEWPREWARQANSELLQLFLHYKVFTRQLDAQQSFYTAFMCTCMSITMLVPLVARLHAPYFDSNQAAKRLFVVVSFCFVGPATLCMLPPCGLHRRCQDLAKSLMYLTAHLANVNQHSAAAATPRLYDEHLASALRREVAFNCCGARDRFAIRLGLASLSYTSLLEFYFWFGLVLVSIVASTGSQTPTSGGGGDSLTLRGLLDDPFRVYGS